MCGSRLLPRALRDAAATISSLICTMSALKLHVTSLLAARADLNRKANRSSTLRSDRVRSSRTCKLAWPPVTHPLTESVQLHQKLSPLWPPQPSNHSAWPCCPSLLIVARLLTLSPFDSTFHVIFHCLEDCSSHFLDEKSSFLPSLECHRLELAGLMPAVSWFSNGSDPCLID